MNWRIGPALFAGTNNSDSSINKMSSTSYCELSLPDVVVVVSFPVGGRFYPLRGHVGGAPGVPGLGLRVNQPAGNSKITELDPPFAVQEDVGGLHVTVDHVVLLLQVSASPVTNSVSILLTLHH